MDGKVFCTDNTKMFRNIVKHGIVYLNDHPKIPALVLGLSGGIDSAMTAAVAREICDTIERDVQLIGVSIPIETNTKSEIKRARQVGEAFCDEFIQVKFIDIGFRLFKLLRELFWTSMYHSQGKYEKIRLGNIKARLRMIYLYDKAHRNGGIVLSTDNLSEYYLNFFTLHGDVGDLGLVQNIWKTELYGIADRLINYYYREFKLDKAKALSGCYTAVPTDGLGITPSDFQQLGVDSYAEVDDVLKDEAQALLGFKMTDGHEAHPIVRRSRKYAFKRKNPYNIARELIITGPETKILDKL